MTDSCSPCTSFPDMNLMQKLSTNYSVIWAEICKIQQEILAAGSQCRPGGPAACTTIAGNSPMTFVSGISQISVQNGGTGYIADKPTLQFIPPNGVTPSDIATADIVSNGSIQSISITNPGQGYHPVKSTLSVSSLTGAGAVIVPLVNSIGQIVNVDIDVPGNNYNVGDSVIASRADYPNMLYTDATIKVSSVSTTGAILSVDIINPGSGYQDSVSSVEIVSSLSPSLRYPVGLGFRGTVVTDVAGSVLNVIIQNPGAGYTELKPTLVINDFGQGAKTAVTLVNDGVSSVEVLDSGYGYTQSATASIINPITAAEPTTDAIVSIAVQENTFNTDPSLYWRVWSGAETNTVIQRQLTEVIQYFTKLKYTIQIESNPLTMNTIQWKVCW